MTMTPTELLRTIYLGDRSCKVISIEGWSGRVSLQVDVISRVRSSSGAWQFYTDEDVPDGRLVFTNVSRIGFEPSRPVPNDLINEIRVDDVRDLLSGKTVFVFSVSLSSVDETGASTEVRVEIHAEGLHLEDPQRPGVAIHS